MSITSCLFGRLRPAADGLSRLLILVGLIVTGEAVGNAAHGARPRPGSVTAARQLADTDHDGLSDYSELHKYFTDPHKWDTAGKGIRDGDWKERTEFTYTITSVIRVLKPCNPAVMNDDYQDVRILAQDRDSYTLEIVYYPLNTHRAAIEANPNWRADDAGMHEYLKPTTTCNWDARMRADLLAQLKADGIDAARLSDKALVEQVSSWAMQRSTPAANSGDGMPIAWYVTFPHGAPTVLPELKHAFDAEKPDPAWDDRQMLDQQVIGKSMFYQKKHGACTSSSIYLATILRALGIPTRIVYFIPPADGNDPAQVKMLLGAIHHHAVRDAIRKGLANAQGFCNHMFNEVYVGKRWVRLNYASLGQNILDPWYFGLLTHIDTCVDIRESNLAATWGLRSARYPNVRPRLTSINPYMLLRVSDHFGRYSHIPNPPVVVREFKTVTLTEAHWKDEPGFAPADIGFGPETDLLLGIKESLPGEPHPLRDFLGKAGTAFLLQTPGHPDIRLRFSGETDDFAIVRPRAEQSFFHGFGVHIAAEDRSKLAANAPYTLIPLNTSARYRWITAGPVILPPPGSRGAVSGSAIPATIPRNLTALTVIEMCWKGSATFQKFIPPSSLSGLPAELQPDCIVSVKEHIPGQDYHQYGMFYQHTGHAFVLKAAGRPDVRLTVTSLTCTSDSAHLYGFGCRFAPGESAKMVRGIPYTLHPVDPGAAYPWAVPSDLTVTAP